MRWANYILLLAIGLIWGSQFFFVKVVVDDVQPLALAAYKAIFGAATLGIISLFMKVGSSKPRVRTSKKLWLPYILIALLEAVIPFFLIGWGQQRISSSLTSILMGTIPIFTILLAAIFVPKEKINVLKWISVVCGFIGMLILIAPDISSTSVSSNVYGILAILGASLSFAGSLILLNRLSSISPLIAMRNVLLIAAVVLVPLAFIFEGSMKIVLSYPQWGALIILGVFHAGIVYMLYNLLINRAGAIFASLNNYLVPLVGVILGVVILQEHLKMMDYISLIIIIASLAIGGMDIRKGKSL